MGLFFVAVLKMHDSQLLVSQTNMYQLLVCYLSFFLDNNSSILHVYSDALSGALETTEDSTSSDNRTWKTNATNWIPPSFGATFQLKVYAAPTGLANAQSTGTQLFETGSGNDDQWYYDYQSGVLHFIGTNLPTDIGTGTSNVIYVSGAKYVGSTGIGDAIGARALEPSHQNRQDIWNLRTMICDTPIRTRIRPITCSKAQPP